MEATIEHVRALWRSLTNAPEGFTEPLTIVESDDHRCSPPGWVGIVSIADAVVVSSPQSHVEHVQGTLRQLEPEALANPLHVERALTHEGKLAPALLFYAHTRPGTISGVVSAVDMDDERVRKVISDAAPAEVDEAGLDTDAIGLSLAVDSDGGPGAICGWHSWPHDVAHMGVLTARASRGTGCGTRAAAHAVGSAIDRGQLPQWRAAAANDASIALARSLGLIEVGWQLSLAPPTS